MVVDLIKDRKATHSGQVQGGFSMYRLPTKRKNECK